ncbi:hypothetical protein [Hyphomicrobium sp. DY-1]|uniref:hypothetical protein n=1 Tax=Hyphomicrobium sp. DY-1 TaxID=3075650 RepID=UPI0039C0EE4F
MAKTVSKGSKKSSGGARWVVRDSHSGQFKIGRDAFASISSVEGISLSQDMRKVLARTEGMSAAKRRSELASKYGKK